MERISVSLDESLVAQFEQFLQAKGYSNRSEAIRDLIREKLEAERAEHSAESYCVGTLTYVYNHEERELARRLTLAQHAHHDLSVSTLHVHLDHDNCLETVVLKGVVEQVQAFANSITSQPGVRHGQLNIIPVDMDSDAHRHGAEHTHIRPQT